MPDWRPGRDSERDSTSRRGEPLFEVGWVDSRRPQPNVEVGWVDALGNRSDAGAPPRLTAEEMKTAYTLIERVRRWSKVREIAEKLLDNPGQPLPSLQPLIQALIRPNRAHWRERQLATWVLGRANLNPEQRTFAAETLTQVLERRLERDTSDKVRRAVFRGIGLSFLLTLFIKSGDYSDPAEVILMQSLSFLVPLALLWQLVREESDSQRIRATAATSLGYLQDPIALDALTAALFETRSLRLSSPRPLREAAAAALPSVLARLTPEHYGQIRMETMSNLCRALNHPDDTLVIAVLNALGVVGDTQALSFVEKLAKGGGRAGKDKRIQAAASEALTRIQARINARNARQELLRASSPQDTPPEMLLRPAAGSSLTDPLQLLRSAARDGAVPQDGETELILAILGDLQQSGDSRALPYVEQIAANESVAPYVREAARACLPSLRAKAEVESLEWKPYTGEDAGETISELRIQPRQSE